ncbi:MAG: hypothetical protein ABI977_04950 [Acidobacteriota bacterium]
MRSIFFALLMLLTVSARAQVTVTNYASGRPEIAPESLAIVDGLDLQVQAESARSIAALPWSLAGTGVSVEGVPARLRFVGSRSIVFMVPRMAARFSKSRVTVRIVAPQDEIAIEVDFAQVSPGLLCYGAPRDDCFPPQAIYYQQGNAPLLVDGEPLALSQWNNDARIQIVGTGMRGASRNSVEVKLCDSALEVTYIGPYMNMQGMDCVTFILPVSLPAGCAAGRQPITVTANGKTSNVALLNLKESQP